MRESGEKMQADQVEIDRLREESQQIKIETDKIKAENQRILAGLEAKWLKAA